jgi:hypothetical protein
MGMENVPVNFSVLEELSNDTEDGNFVPESVCRKRCEEFKLYFACAVTALGGRRSILSDVP